MSGGKDRPPTGGGEGEKWGWGEVGASIQEDFVSLDSHEVGDDTVANLLFSVQMPTECQDPFMYDFQGFLPNPYGTELSTTGQDRQAGGATQASTSETDPLHDYETEASTTTAGTASTSDGFKAPAPRKRASLKSKVVMIRAFQGLAQTVNSKANISAEDYNAIVNAVKQGSASSAVAHVHAQLHPAATPASSGAGSSPLHILGTFTPSALGSLAADQGMPTGMITPAGMAGSRIDAELKRMDDMNQAVLSDDISLLESEWVLPDLALIFRPPKSVMENIAVSIRPGQWAKIAPSALIPRADNLLDGNRSWDTLRRALNTGIAFRIVAKNKPDRTEQEEINFKIQLQQEVDQFKTFFLSISRAWEDYMIGDQMERAQTPPPTSADVSRASSVSSTPGTPENAIPLSPSGHGWIRPIRSPFQVKAIATGICQIFPQLHRDIQAGLIDIETLAHICPYPWPPESASCQIVDVITTLGHSKKSAGDASHGGTARAKKERPVCAFKMKIFGGGDNITLRIWANGKTQASGCKDRAMLLEANRCVAAVIRHLVQTAPEGPRVLRTTFLPHDMQEEVRVLSAPMLGSWDLNLKSVGGKMDMGRLCDYLSSPKFQNKVVKVTHIAPKGNSARFNNLSLYIRKECLRLWSRDDTNDQSTVYVNVYEAGKCSVLAVPDISVAEELADVVSDMLFDAFEQDGIGVTVKPPAKRKRGKDGLL